MKSALCIALAGMMMLGVCGCGKNGGADSAVAEAKVLSEGTTFAETDFNFSAVEEAFESGVLVGDYIFYISIKSEGDDESNDDTFNITSNLNKVDINSGEVTKIAQLLPKDERYFANIVKGADGNIYLLKSGMDEGSEILCRIVDDKLEEDVELKEFKDASNPDMYYSVDLVDKNGNYVMSSEGGLRICDKDSNELFSKPLSNGYIFGCANTKDGDIAVYYESYENDQTSSQVMIIGTDSYEVKKEITLKDQLSYNNPIMDGCGGYDLLYMSNTALFGYDIASENATKLVGFNDSNINIDACSGIYMIDSKTFIVDKTEYEGDSFEDASFTFVKYSKESAVDASGKTILTYAAIYADSDIKDDIIEFNKSQSDYMVKLVDYAEEAGAYFAGDKSVDEVITIIENRVNTYINENR